MATSVQSTSKTRLQELERVIEKGLDTFVEVGKALLEIRDSRLYRQEGHSTFEDYCHNRWRKRISRPRAYQLIEAAQVVENLSTVVDKLPQNEWQARELSELEPEQQRQVWSEAVKGSRNGQPTAAEIREVKNKTLPQIIREERRRLGFSDPGEVEKRPALTPKEKEQEARFREAARRNTEYTVKVMAIVHAIENLSRPQLPLAEIAAEIVDMDSPDMDWCNRAHEAKANLEELIRRFPR